MDSWRSAVRDDLYARFVMDPADVQCVVWLGADHLRGLDARALICRHARGTAEPPDEDDELYDAGGDDDGIAQLRIGAQPLLRSAKHCRLATTMAIDAGADEGGSSVGAGASAR